MATILTLHRLKGMKNHRKMTIYLPFACNKIPAQL